MKNKNIYIIALVLILSLLGCIVTSAAMKVEPIEITNNKDKINTEKFTHVLSDRTKVDLTFVEKFDTLWETRYNYIDAENNEFTFDKDGDLVAVSFDDSWLDEMDRNGKLFELTVSNPLKDSDWVSEDTALDIAKEHTTKMYGDILNNFKLESATKEYGYIYDLTFKTTGGKDDCITTSFAYVRMFYDGTVLGSSIHQHKVATSIDENKLDKIDINFITSVAEENAKAIFADSLRGLDVREVLLVQDGDNFGLEISAHIDFYDEDMKMIGGSLETFYYNIK